ncbi:TetR/AcrR family transcriptional regulator [Spongiibacter sp. KMU-158]|uniref:TetR/AcrR family transcriptional regulator n=2 Tax=Spongiibacter pelagi TaxID=2760804 RepID=A0A927C273_9GAMM|nr:TetR/AcrR family transcriptional regulator [Spongiibacter pelagi]
MGVLLRRLIDEGCVSDPESPKGRLLAAAARQFRQKGFSRTTVRDLAAEVGILSGSIFHHFKNKDEILFAVMNEVVIAMEERLQVRLSAATSTRDKVRALIENELQFIHGPTGDATAVLIYEWRALSEPLQQKILERRRAYFKLWHDTLIKAEEEALITVEPDCLRQLLHGAIVWSIHWYQPQGPMPLESLVDQVLSLAIKSE